ncbi:MAG: tRNA lysidine(34) synthetase TilS [Bacteroidota bacterium]
MGLFLDRLSSALQELCGDPVGRVAVAVSGGVDSVVLLRGCRQLEVDVVALHVDHGLRPESKTDAAFVGELAAELGVSFESLTVRVDDGNRQHEARTARYAALADAARRHDCSVVASGHTATDQAETVLMHLICGSGLRGLAGMAARRPLSTHAELVRPLLWATREEVEAEAQRLGWGWREDPSNAMDAYRRNRIRHHVLPLLQAEGGPGTIHHIAASANAARAALPDLMEVTMPEARSVNLDALREALDRHALWAEALAAWAPDVRRTTSLIRQLDGLVDGQVGRFVPVGEQRAWRDRDAIRFVTPADPVEVHGTVGDTLATAFGTLDLVECVPDHLHAMSSPDPSGCLELMTPGALAGDLCLRTWREGDRIAPTGMAGTKLVSDLLTERRVRPSERDRQLVLCAEGGVAWVVGHRVAEWAGHRDPSQRLVRATWTPADSVC